MVWVIPIIIAAWLGEATSIDIYGFYQYENFWWFKIARVPLLVPLIWPIVILTGREVVISLFPDQKKFWPLMVGIIVFFDASTVEIAAVSCGLWSWNVPGYLQVPFMGVTGWAIFAFVVAYFIDRFDEGKRWLLVAVAPIALHVMMVVSWWVLFRWLLRGDWFWFYGISILAVAFVLLVVRASRKIPGPIVCVRIMAAGMFIALVISDQPGNSQVWLHMVLLIVPYLLVTDFSAFKANR